MNKIKFTASILFFLAILPVSFAHASSPFFSSYAELYTVNAQGSTAQQTSFSYNQQPYLYVELYNPPPANISSQLTFTAWQNPSATNIYSTAVFSNTNQNWVSFSQSFWNSVSTPGTWNITATSINPLTGAETFYGQTSFTMNAAPEPLGVILFLTGALIMGISIMRRKKAIVV